MTSPERFPRIKKGPTIFATRDGAPGEEAGDQLLVNSYLGRYFQAKDAPEYWRILNRMLYGKGRIKKYAGAVEDIVDKFSFLLLARDQIVAHEATLNLHKRFHVKYYSYTFVYMTKAFLDSIAVFINEFDQLGFNGGEIGLLKGKFRDEIRSVNPELGGIIDKMQKWIDDVVQYRDTLIHCHGLYIGPLPTIPEEMKDLMEQTKYILEEHHYMPVDPTDTEDKIIDRQNGEFIKVTALVDEWINESFTLFETTLRYFAMKFELESVVKSKESKQGD